jgi:DivIVA domain-containing protein
MSTDQRSEFSPEAIAQHRFNTAFRGFEPDEVRTFLERVAGHVSHLEAKIRVLQVDLDECRSAAAADLEADAVREAVLVDAPEMRADSRSHGRDEADRVLAAARDEATLLVSRANEEAGRIVLRARAESRGRAGGSDTPHLIGSDLPDDPEAARQAARAMVAEARAVRERILTDLAKRRRTAHVQLEQLRVARERLMESLRETRRVIDGATRDLTHVETEARLAAEAAGRRVAAEPMPSAEDIDAELLGGRHLQFVGAAERSEPSGVVVVDDVVDESRKIAATDAVVASVEVDDVVVVEDAVAEVVVEVDAGDAGAQTEEVPTVAAVAENTTELAVVGDVIDLTDPDASADEAIEATSETPVDSAADASESNDSDPGTPTGGSARPHRRRANRSAVDSVFAQLRDQRPAEAASTPASSTGSVAVLERPAVETIVTDATAPEPTVGIVVTETVTETVTQAEAVKETVHIIERSTDAADDETLLAHRSSVLTPIVISTVRALRRLLQDEQSEALVAVRSSRTRPDADQLFGTGEAQLARYRNAMRPGLVDVATTCSADVTAISPTLDDVAEDLLSEVVSARRRRVESVISSDAPIDQIGESVRSTAREWSTERMTTRVNDVLCAAYAVSVYSLIRPGTPVRWVLDDGSATCSDCDDDVLGDGTAAGEAFPTGHHRPPVHRGCRCLVVAV